MKTWNAPVISELNINETANGLFDACFEAWPLFDEKKTTPEDPDNPS